MGADYSGPERRIATVPETSAPVTLVATVLKQNQIRIAVIKIGLFVIIIQNSLVMGIFWLATMQAQHLFRGVSFPTLLSILMVLNAMGILIFAAGWRRAEVIIRRSAPP